MALWKFAALATVIAAVASPVLAQSSATVTVNATGRIIAPMTLTKNSDLTFGTIIKPSTGAGTVTIGTGADTVALTGGAAAMGAVSRAKFTVGGEGGQTYAVTVPSSFVLSSGGNNLTVALTPSATSGTLSGALGASGTDTINVGGAFTVASTQATGAYTGSFAVTTAYN
jgi:hypothetical protein